MAKSPIEVDAVKSMKSLTIRVRIRRWREMRIRNWIGAQLVKLAALIMNCSIEFIRDDDEDLSYQEWMHKYYPGRY